jgi:uncharacterized membrane protein
MNASHHRWLHDQLPQWERDGLVTTENAASLRQRHPFDDSQPAVAQLVMGALGGLLIGAGLIAIIGYNWDDFTRPVRLLFAFLPLLGSQVFSLLVLRKGDSAAAWVRETAAMLQTMATGACIALVSQIYNLGGAWPDFLFAWFLLSLPLVWLMRSTSVAIFYLLAIAEWSVHQCDLGKVWYQSALIYPLLLLGLFPFWPGFRLEKSFSVTLRWIMALSASFGLGAAAYFATKHHFGRSWGDGDIFFSLWAFTAAAMALFPLNQNALDSPARHKPQIVLGFLVLLVFSIASTFQDSGEEIVKSYTVAAKIPWTWVVLITTGLFAVHAIRTARWAVLAMTSVIITPLAGLIFGSSASTAIPWLMTLHLLILGITLIVLEFSGRRGAPRLGAALLCLLLLARMFESDLSLLAKGIAFIVIGVAFLAFNIAMGRLKKRLSSSKS